MSRSGPRSPCYSGAMLRDRPWATAAIWLVSVLTVQLLAWMAVEAREPDASLVLRIVAGIVVGIVVTPMMALLLVRAIGGLEDDLRVARAGSTSEQTDRLAQPGTQLGDLRDPFARAAIAIETGQLDLARRHLAEWSLEVRARRGHPDLVRARFVLAERGAAAAEAALAALMARPPQRSLEVERYRAYVTALAAGLVPDRSPAVPMAAAALAAHGDAEVRAYAAWIRAWLELPLAEGERAADAQRGAELARMRGHTELARRLEGRASALATARTANPYRGDARRVA